MKQDKEIKKCQKMIKRDLLIVISHYITYFPTTALSVTLLSALNSTSCPPLFRRNSALMLFKVACADLLIFCYVLVIENLVCTRRAAETTAPFRSAHSAPGRATGTFPRARRGRAHRWSMCGR